MPTPARRSGVVWPLLGGALAAVGGFGLSHFDVLGLAPPDQSAEIAALEGRQGEAVAAVQAALNSALADLDARIAAVETAPAADLSGIAALEDRLRVIEEMPAGDSTAALASQLAALERRMAELPAGGAATDEVDAALARLAEVEAEAQARADEAAVLANAAAQAQALEDLAAAVQAGAGFEAELAAVTDPDLQATLAAHVAGVASLAELQAQFPDAARATLQAAREVSAEDGWGSRVVDFLAAQTGARPLTPQEGTTPEAVLSRAEFALGEGRVDAALAEVQTLDPALRAPMGPWIALATARVAVDAALAEAM